MFFFGNLLFWLVFVLLGEKTQGVNNGNTLLFSTNKTARTTSSNNHSLLVSFSFVNQNNKNTKKKSLNKAFWMIMVVLWFKLVSFMEDLHGFCFGYPSGLVNCLAGHSFTRFLGL
jgi:hypothetical protein